MLLDDSSLIIMAILAFITAVFASLPVIIIVLPTAREGRFWNIFSYSYRATMSLFLLVGVLLLSSLFFAVSSCIALTNNLYNFMQLNEYVNIALAFSSCIASAVFIVMLINIINHIRKMPENAREKFEKYLGKENKEKVSNLLHGGWLSNSLLHFTQKAVSDHYRARTCLQAAQMLCAVVDNVNAIDEDGYTALIWVLRRFNRDYGLVEMLLAHKEINVNAKNNDGKTALILADERGHAEVGALLRESKQGCQQPGAGEDGAPRAQEARFATSKCQSDDPSDDESKKDLRQQPSITIKCKPAVDEPRLEINSGHRDVKEGHGDVKEESRNISLGSA